MDDLSDTMEKTSLSGEEAVDADMVSELLRMMQTQKLSALSVDDLVKHLATIKVSKQSSSPVPTKSAPPETPEDMGSPAFSFKSPDAVFTPFKIKETTGKKGKKDVEKSFQFGSDSGSDDDNAKGGPFSSHQVHSKTSGFHSTSRENAHKASRPSTAENGLFANAGLNSIGASQPANGVQFSIGGTSKSSKRNGNKTTTAKDQHGKTFTFTPSQRAVAQGFADPAAGANSANNNNNGTFFWGGQQAATGSLPNSYNNPIHLDGTTGSSFTSSQAANTKNAPAQPPATTAVPLPFTFTIGSDGTTTKNRISSTAANKTATTKPSTFTGPFTSANQGTPASAGYMLGSSDLLDSTRPSHTTNTNNTTNSTPNSKNTNTSKTTTKQADTSSVHDNSTDNIDTAYIGDGASFTVYTLGEGDVLHSLNEYSSDDTQSVNSNINDPVDPTMDVHHSTPKAAVFGSDGEGEFQFSPDDIPDLPEGMETSFGSDSDDDGGDVLQESFNNLDQSSRTTASASFHVGSTSSSASTNANKGPFSALNQSDIPVFTFPVTPFPSTATSTTNTASGNNAAKNGTASVPTASTAGQFLFNGQSMAASQSQFEKENFNFTIPTTTATTAASTGANNSNSNNVSGVGIQYDEDVARRIAEAFSNLSNVAPKTTASGHASSSGAASAPKVSSVPVTPMPAPTSTATATTTASAAASNAAAPAPTPVFAFPIATPSHSGAAGAGVGSTAKVTPEVPDLASAFKGFNIGAFDKNLGSSKTTSQSAKKSSPVKAKVHRSGGVSNTSSSDNAGFSSKGGSSGANMGVNSEFKADEAPAWWKEARAAGMQTGECYLC